MTDTAARTRQPSGTPVGGQFASTRKPGASAGVELTEADAARLPVTTPILDRLVADGAPVEVVDHGNGRVEVIATLREATDTEPAFEMRLFSRGDGQPRESWVARAGSTAAEIWRDTYSDEESAVLGGQRHNGGFNIHNRWAPSAFGAAQPGCPLLDGHDCYVDGSYTAFSRYEGRFENRLAMELEATELWETYSERGAGTPDEATLARTEQARRAVLDRLRERDGKASWDHLDAAEHAARAVADGGSVDDAVTEALDPAAAQ